MLGFAGKYSLEGSADAKDYYMGLLTTSNKQR